MPEVNSLVLNVKSDSVKKATDQLGRFTTSAKKAELATGQYRDANGRLRNAQGRYIKATTGATTATTGYATAAKGATSATAGLSTAIKSMIAPLLAVLGPLLVMKTAIGIVGELEHAMSAVEAVTGATSGEMQELETVARGLGATTVFSATQAAKGMAFLGMAGFETNEIISAMPGLLDLAAAGQLELAEASDIASNVLSGFRLEAEETGRVGDVLALGAASANTNVQQLGKALSFTAPISAALGISLETTAAAIGVMSDAGIQGQRAGTGLRTVLASLSSITPKAEKALRGMGLTAKDINPEINSLGTILKTLEEAGLDATGAFKIFGTEGAPAILALTSQVDRLQELQGSLEGAEGAAAAMAITLSSDLHGSYKKLGSVASEFAIRLDETIGASDLWRDAIDSITESVGGLSDALGVAASTGEPAINTLVRTYDSLVSRATSGDVQSFTLLKVLKDDTTNALKEFSEVEIALARAENELADLVATATPRSKTLKQGLFENIFTFNARQAEQARADLAEFERGLTDEQRAASAQRIAAKEEEIQILQELFAVQAQMDETAAATAATAATAAAEAKKASAVDDAANLAFERLQRQLQTEEEAIIASYEKRIAIILENTEMGSALRLDLETRAAEEAETAILKIEKRKAKELDDIQKSQFENFQQTSLLTATLVGQLADLAEEGTSTQKALFIAQKGISIAQAIVNTELAATRATAEAGPFLGIPLATTIRALGYASVGIMAGTTVGSFATGGIVPGASFTGDNLTANVNSGEMILNSAQQARLFEIADNRTQTGSGGVNVTVENYGSSEITVEQINENDIRIIARDMAKQIVREDAPTVIASDLQSANSRTSRSLSQNTKTERRR